MCDKTAKKVSKQSQTRKATGAKTVVKNRCTTTIMLTTTHQKWTKSQKGGNEFVIPVNIN